MLWSSVASRLLAPVWPRKTRPASTALRRPAIARRVEGMARRVTDWKKWNQAIAAGGGARRVAYTMLGRQAGGVACCLPRWRPSVRWPRRATTPAFSALPGPPLGAMPVSRRFLNSSASATGSRRRCKPRAWKLAGRRSDSVTRLAATRKSRSGARGSVESRSAPFHCASRLTAARSPLGKRDLHRH